MKALARILILLGVLVVGLAVVNAASAASPEPSQDTLGASVQTHVYISDEPTIIFTNLSTVPAVFAFIGDSGWTTDRAEVTLDAGAQGSVTVVGDGVDGAAIDVSVTTAGDVASGMTRTALAFQSKIAHERPFDPTPLILGALFGVLAFIALVFVLAKTKPWTLRIARAR